MRYGKDASANPWGAIGLEWETSSPPPVENFDTPPRVGGEAYDYNLLTNAPSMLPPTREAHGVR
jgi:cytochrome c oxidase subunit 1